MGKGGRREEGLSQLMPMTLVEEYGRRNRRVGTNRGQMGKKGDRGREQGREGRSGREQRGIGRGVVAREERERVGSVK